MITSSPLTRHQQALSWQQQMAGALTDPQELIDALGLGRELLAPAQAAARAFGLRVPLSYVARMRRGDPQDPLLRQVLPLGEELQHPQQFAADPLGEAEAMRAPALLQKYRGRALIIATSSCAVHCRYCFRREFPYAEQSGAAPRWSAALEAIAKDDSLEEIILSGGDPFSLGNSRLAALTDALARIPHIVRLRVHTRQPVVLPARVDDGLVSWLEQLRWRPVIVLHANHPNEIDESVRLACERLKRAGATLLNQSVLLRGVNDDAGTLALLSQRLFDSGVLPYYLHVLDRVRGAAHFEIPETRAREIAGQLAARLPGYLVPRLMRERAGAPAKVALPPILARL